MFKKLHTIRGEQLFQNKYALVVVENYKLQKLFNINKQNLTIVNGSVYIHNDKVLCNGEITRFLEHVNLVENVTENDVSQHSNGENALCDIIPLNISLVDVNANSFILTWSKIDTTCDEKCIDYSTLLDTL
uniref:Receptor L-domain domain-containing protein n=1 Tax=Acrobeloides nanus TaxID=290746 RepID=A0A914CMG7_9BILA